MRFFIQLSYDGTGYHGWQRQDNAHSVQEELEKSLGILLQEKVEVTGAGRTDTGVHATYYIAHFETEKLQQWDEKNLFRLNCLLPEDMAVQAIYPVKADAHARFDATYREYKYYICQTKDPFSFLYAMRERRPLDVAAMNDAASALFEYQDFTSFSKLGSDVKTNNCQIFKALWTEEGGKLVFTIRADRFLRNMVRAIVGTLLEVGLGKITKDDFRKIIEKKDRSSAGVSVPAKGLFLVDIGYVDVKI